MYTILTTCLIITVIIMRTSSPKRSMEVQTEAASPSVAVTCGTPYVTELLLIYNYVYIYRERDTHICIHIYIYIHMHTHIFTYIYIYI